MNTTEKHAIRYIYYRGETKTSTGHNGIISAGYKYMPEINSLMITFAFCSPKDRFCKRTARNIINGRFETEHTTFIDNLGDKREEPKYGDVAKHIRNWWNITEEDNDGLPYRNIFMVECKITRKCIPYWAKQIA